MNKFINWGLIGLGNASLNLAKEFRNISEEDRETSGFFIQGTKNH